MLEQSILHGRIFCSKMAGKTLASKPVSPSSIRFGPMRQIRVYRISDIDMWVEDIIHKDWYHYLGTYGSFPMSLDGTAAGKPEDLQPHGCFYYYGKALVIDAKGEEPVEHAYFLQNEPVVAYKGTPDIQVMEMPLTMQALDYDQVFSYLPEIKELLDGIPASYVDRFKRPVKRVQGRTYPIAMDSVKTTWGALPETTYPIVVDFSKTVYGVADLEPVHTDDDLEHFQSIPGYYEEETPRGGKHKLVRLTDNTFKFRYSPGLEIINQSQVTLYGINAKWLTGEPEVLDVSPYETVGHKTHAVHAVLERPDVRQEVVLLRKKAEENLSMGAIIAAKIYRADMDESHGEYMALRTLYEQDIAPYEKQFDKDLLPWILEAYAKNIISHRDKHETCRQGLPYLVYLAAIIIGRNDVTRVWNEKRCISSEPGV